MLLPLLLLIQTADPVDVAVANYHAKTRAEVQCQTAREDGEIVVCSRREADKYRVPLVEAGGTRDSVPARTAKLTKDYQLLPCGQRAIIAQCGPGFGVGVTVGQDGHTRLIERQLAP